MAAYQREAHARKNGCPENGSRFSISSAREP
jgi:hypothetical protein